MPNQENAPLRVTLERPDPKSSPRADAIILKISGEIGITSMVGPGGQHSGVKGDTLLDEALNNAVTTPPPIVVVDLNAVSYLSSLGMGALVRFHNRLKESGSELRLAGATDLVQSLLKRCRLDRAFKLYPDVEAALKAP